VRTNIRGIEMAVRGTAAGGAVERLRYDEFSAQWQHDIGRPEVKGARIHTDDDRIDRERPARIVHDPDSASVYIRAARAPLDNHLMNGGWWGVFLRIRDEVVSMEHHQRQAAQGTLGPRWARSNRTQDDQRPHALCIALLTDPEGHATTFLLEAWWPTHLKT